MTFTKENDIAKLICCFLAPSELVQTKFFSIFKRILSRVLNLMNITNKFLKTAFLQNTSGRLFSYYFRFTLAFKQRGAGHWRAAIQLA